MSKVAAPLLQTRQPPFHHQNTPPKNLNPLRSCTDKRLRPWLNKPVFGFNHEPGLNHPALWLPASQPPSLLPRDKHSIDREAGGRKEETERKANSSITTQASQFLAVKSVVELNIRFYKPKSYLLLLACSAVEVRVY